MDIYNEDNEERKGGLCMRFVITKDYDELSHVITAVMLKHMHTGKPRSTFV